MTEWYCTNPACSHVFLSDDYPICAICKSDEWLIATEALCNWSPMA